MLVRMKTGHSRNEPQRDFHLKWGTTNEASTHSYKTKGNNPRTSELLLALVTTTTRVEAGTHYYKIGTSAYDTLTHINKQGFHYYW